MNPLRIPLLSASLAALLLTAPLGAQFRQLYLSGKVVMQDGSAPPEPVIIRLYCPSGRQPEAYTNAEGAFNFPVGGSQSRRVVDASRRVPGASVGASGSDQSFVRMTDCELRAHLPGYLSSVIHLGRRSVFESPDVGTLVLRPADKSDDALVSVNTLAAPPKAQKAYGKARKEMAKEKPNRGKAVKQLRAAVKEYPRFAAAWNLLGQARVGEGNLEEARQAFLQAAEADPRFAPPRLALALMELQQGRYAETLRLTDEVLAVAPNLAEAHYYRAVACSALGKLEETETSARAVIAGRDAERYPRARFLLGNVLAQRGDLSGAAEEFQRFIEIEPNSRAAEAVRSQLAQWKTEGLLR